MDLLPYEDESDRRRGRRGRWALGRKEEEVRKKESGGL
jgi:hypothetical protein